MKTFVSIFRKLIRGQITTFDRMIFHGYLTSFFPKGAFKRFLCSQHVLLKDFGRYVNKASVRVKEYAQQIAQEAGRPYIPLQQTMTKRRGKSKEDLAREIAQRDGVTEGLICVVSALENCTSFDVEGNRQEQKLEVVTKRRKCLHFYFYLFDYEFGFMHVRLQSWFPFSIQVYINGREWLGKQMDKRGIRYERYENSFLEFGRGEVVQRLCKRFARKKWPKDLHSFARTVNPLLPLIRKAGFGEYWWVLDQAEIATDVMFRSRGVLASLMPDILKYAVTMFSSEDVLRFLGKKPHGNFTGEVTTDMKRRPEGYRVKHRVRGNSIKVYDKWSVLRIETTICQPREFKVLRVIRRPRKKPVRVWKPMGKGVANVWRYMQVGLQANSRYLEALAQVQLRGTAVKELDGLCRPVRKGGKRYAKLQPLSRTERDVFREILSTDHAILGVRNRDVREALYRGAGPVSEEEARRRCARVSRMLRKLWGHGLIYRVKKANLYRVTRRGYRIMSSILSFHDEEFAEGYAAAS